MNTQTASHLVATKYCHNCGREMHPAMQNCPSCGVRVDAHGAPGRRGRSRTAAILLCFFLGGIGVHKFYLGQWGWGLIYFLFCWTFIPSVVALIEFIILLVMSEEDFAAKYG